MISPNTNVIYKISSLPATKVLHTDWLIIFLHGQLTRGQESGTIQGTYGLSHWIEE